MQNIRYSNMIFDLSRYFIIRLRTGDKGLKALNEQNPFNPKQPTAPFWYQVAFLNLQKLPAIDPVQLP